MNAMTDLSAGPEALLALAADWVFETDGALAFTLVTGQSAPQELKGKALLPLLRFDLMDSGSAADHTEQVYEAIAARKPVRELVIETVCNGQPSCHSLTALPVFASDGAFAGYHGVAKDVTRLIGTRSEVALLKSQLSAQADHARLAQSVLDSIDDAMFIKDENLRFVLANAPFARLFGKTPAEIVGKMAKDVVGAEDGLVFEAGEKTVLASGVSSEVEEDYAVDGVKRARIVRKSRVTDDSGRHYLACFLFDISELRSREQRLAEETHKSEQILADMQSVMDAMLMGVVLTNADLSVQFVNKAFHRIWGTPDDGSFLGGPFRKLMDFNRSNGVYDIADADWETYVASRTEEIRRGEVLPREFVRKDGVTLNYSVTELGEGRRLVCYFDVTSHREQEAALRLANSQNELFRNIIDNLKVAIYAKKTDLSLVYANRGWEKLSGVSAAAAHGKTDFDIYGEDGRAFMADDLSVIEKATSAEFQETATLADGSISYRIAHKDVMTASDGSVYLIGSTTDVTAMKETENALRVAQEKAILADRAKSEFLANMSHEIRTPMNGVLGMAELLAKTELDGKQKMFTDVIVKSGNALLTIINDILDFSKIDAGQLVLDPAPFTLAEAVEDVATLVSTRAKEKDLELIVRVQPGLPARFVGDVGRIRQIITNLMGNAVKFTEKGHVLVDVTGTDTGSETQLQFRVVDTGIGIPKHMLGQVFEKFSQVDTTSTRRHEGTGLGLAITSKLLDLMGGTIRVESEEGRGSTFSFTVTLPNSGQETNQKVTPTDVTGARIIIIDDNQVNRSILTEQMRSWTFDSCAASNGPEGIAVLKAVVRQGMAVDCIILDYQMPGMNGRDVARAIRQTPEIADTPIIVLTSVDQSLSPEDVRDLMIDGHLIKPARSSALLEALVSTIQRSRHLKAPAPVKPAPAAIAPVGPAVNATPFMSTSPASAPAHLDILVAEDNEVNQIVFTQILEDTGLTFEIVGNGKLAVEAWRARRPAMILMDVSMPQMNGHEATGVIRKEEAGGKRTPIVGVTAHALKGDREKCLEAGMDDYLSKPISPDALSAKIKQWLPAAASRKSA